MLGDENEFTNSMRPTEAQRMLPELSIDRNLPPPWCKSATTLHYTKKCDRIYIDHMIFAGEWMLAADFNWHPMATVTDETPLPIQIAHLQLSARLKHGWDEIEKNIHMRLDALMTENQFDMLMIGIRIAGTKSPGILRVFDWLRAGDYSRALDALIVSIRYAMLDHPRAGYVISDIARYWHPYGKVDQAGAIDAPR